MIRILFVAIAIITLASCSKNTPEEFEAFIGSYENIIYTYEYGPHEEYDSLGSRTGRYIYSPGSKDSGAIDLQCENEILILTGLYQLSDKINCALRNDSLIFDYLLENESRNSYTKCVGFITTELDSIFLDYSVTRENYYDASAGLPPSIFNVIGKGVKM